jgi:hypothetical protein
MIIKDRSRCKVTVAMTFVVLTFTQMSRPSKRQWSYTVDSWVEVQGDDASDHYTGSWCAHTTVMIASTQADRLPMQQR